MPIPTPEEFVYASVNRYPLLYTATSYADSKMKVYDQIFNTIGNGYPTVAHLIVGMIEFVDSLPAVDQKVCKWFCDEPVMMGSLDLGKDMRGKGDTVYALASEMERHPNVERWRVVERTEFSIYPNFKEKYSLVWEDNFHVLGEKWIQEALWYYQKCREYFDSGAPSYAYKFPRETLRETEECLASLEKHALRSGSTHEEISAAYGVPFDGDVYSFAERRWEAELLRIYTFLDKTQERLEEML